MRPDLKVKKMIDKETLVKLNSKTNDIANRIELLHKKMQGRGVSPVDAPIVIDNLREIEGNLRMLGADEKNPIPF